MFLGGCDEWLVSDFVVCFVDWLGVWCEVEFVGEVD